MSEKLGILKKYDDGYVLPEKRWLQIRHKLLLPHQAVLKELVGYVKIGANYWLLYRESEEYFKSFFAKNSLWWNAIINEPEYVVIGKLKQVYVI